MGACSLGRRIHWRWVVNVTHQAGTLPWQPLQRRTRCAHPTPVCVPMQGGLTCHEQLLLDIYSRIGEPDGIYAVARSHNLLSQLHVFEHEGSWHNALAVQDILSRQTSCARGGADSGAGVRPQELACAQSLGCHHLIACLTQGSHVSGGSGGGACQQRTPCQSASRPCVFFC